jgi:hypothetical protein
VPFQNKIDMTVSQFESFEPVAGTHTNALIDIWYHNKLVRRTAQKRSWDVSDCPKSNRVVSWVAADSSQEWLKLSEYVAGPGREDWQEVV